MWMEKKKKLPLLEESTRGGRWWWHEGVGVHKSRRSMRDVSAAKSGINGIEYIERETEMERRSKHCEDCLGIDTHT